MISRFKNWVLALAAIIVCLVQPAARALDLDQIGVTLLRAMTTNVNGSGVRVAQPEAQVSTNPPSWQVNPASVGQPVGLFAYASADGYTNSFPNTLGAGSDHAGAVGQIFYGLSGGIATNVAHVDSFDADYFINNYVLSNLTALTDQVVNQSFTFGNVSTNLPKPANYLSVSDQQGIDSAYDDYAAAHGTIFISAVNNGGSVSPPGTAYNSIGVGAYGGSSSLGPTIDNGRCKPDISAHDAVTSAATPQVAGVATLLLQAALRGDGGGDTNAAADIRTIKALLLNGAVKPAGWTNSNSSPLDARFGAGVVNAFNSYQQLTVGKQVVTESNLVASGAAHPPSTDTNLVPSANGWDFGIISSSAINDAVNHYLFNVSEGMATVTLVWNRQLGQTNTDNCINNLDLFLFDAASSNLVACSTSRVDNVEHLFVPKLTAGRYDLQVWKAGGPNVVSEAETYALAFAFVSPELNMVKSGLNDVLTWPVYPAGFRVEASTDLVSGVWSANSLPVAIFTNNMNSLRLEVTNGVQFFRLRSPNF